MNKISLQLTSLKCMYIIKLKINMFIFKLRLNCVYNIYFGNEPFYVHEIFKLKSSISVRNSRANLAAGL